MCEKTFSIMFKNAVNNDYRNKKYRDDTVFQKIERNYLTLSDEHRKRNNEHLKAVIEQVFIPLLRKNDLFDTMYKGILYGGSYYKGTRYGKPEEFDLDFILKLPMKHSKIHIDTDHDNYGYVKLKMDTIGQMEPNWEKHSRTLSRWITSDNYLDQDKFRRWMEKVFTLAFNSITSRIANNLFRIDYEGRKYLIRQFSKCGPAFTLKITTPEGWTIDVDLVPCFKFDNVSLGNGYRVLTGMRQSIIVVAKPLPAGGENNILWRLCFYEQEKNMLEGNLKPVIRMMKKFRDRHDLKHICSYFIETIFYHELDIYRFDMSNYLRAPKTWLFMNALKKLRDAHHSKEIRYFWHSQYNLIGKERSELLQGNAKYLQRIIDKIDNEIETNRLILAKYILTADEYDHMQRNGNATENVTTNEPQAVPAEQGYKCIIS